MHNINYGDRLTYDSYPAIYRAFHFLIGGLMMGFLTFLMIIFTFLTVGNDPVMFVVVGYLLSCFDEPADNMSAYIMLWWVLKYRPTGVKFKEKK